MYTEFRRSTMQTKGLFWSIDLEDGIKEEEEEEEDRGNNKR